MDNTKTVYFSIGSNLGDRLNNLQKAVFLMNNKVGTVISTSKIYQSEAWGFESDDFLNACVGIQTTKTADEVLAAILKIEKELGRTRKLEKGYAARTLDIDIVYYDNAIINTNNLIVPHPNLHSRLFVLKPLTDIAPQFYHPILKKDSRNLMQECKDKTQLQKTLHTLYKNRQALFNQVEFMAIEGNIGSGKTTLATKIAKDFNAKLVLERFADNPFLPKFYEDQNRYAFPLEMSFLADRYQQFSDDTSQYDLFKSFMVSDYDIFKSLIFAKITLQEEELKLYRKLFDLMYKEIKKPALYIYLYQNTERLISNIQKRGRAYEKDIKTDYLEKINRGYFDFIKSYPDQNTLVLDVSELDFVANKQDYLTVLTKIENHIITSL